MSVFIGLVLPLVLAYALTFVWVWDSWMLPESYYSHGPLLPLLAAFMVYVRREQWGAQARQTDVRGWWLLGPGLLLHICGAGLTVDSLSAASLCLTIPGAVLLTQGGARWKSLAAIAGLTFFAVPAPMFVSGKAVFVLKEVAVEAGMGLGNLLGAGVTRTGANLFVPEESTPLVVADACGGLRSLVSLLTVGYCVAFFMSTGRGVWRWSLLLLSVPIAVGSNVVRIASMCVMSRWYGVEFGSGTGHDVANAIVWILAIFTLIWIDGRVTRNAE